MKKAAFVMVLYNDSESYDWTKISVTSFREHFPKAPLVAVDQNHNPKEVEFLKSQDAIIINGKRGDQHGTGMDLAIQWCKGKVDVMIHIEPDCIFLGRKWFDLLMSGVVDDGNWMSGSCQYEFGPIHPCPSAWDVNQVKHSFEYVSKRKDIYLPQHHKLIDFKALIKDLHIKNEKHGYTKEQNHVFLYGWDTALKNWFEAASQGKAIKVETTNDFFHFWHGSCRSIEDRMGKIPEFWREELTKALAKI